MLGANVRPAVPVLAVLTVTVLFWTAFAFLSVRVPEPVGETVVVPVKLLAAERISVPVPL